MFVNIILEAMVSKVVYKEDLFFWRWGRGRKVPCCIWISLTEEGIVDTSDDLEEITFHPIGGHDPATGKWIKDETYMLAALTQEYLLEMIDSKQVVKLVGPLPQVSDGVEVQKRLQDLLTTLGHEVRLYETCDY